MDECVKIIFKRLRFYTIKLPFVYLMIPLGFLFEFLVTFPFIVMVAIDARRKRKSSPEPVSSNGIAPKY